jgi:hypothetical protein
MKQIKNGLLVIMSLLVIMTTCTISCSKSDNPPAPPVATPPTITSFSPASAAPGATVTITGTNLTGASSVSFGGTAAASFAVASATSITAVVGTGSSGSVSVVTTGGTASLAGFTLAASPIDGYDNSNQVGKDSLTAYWSFDLDNSEQISGKVPLKAVSASIVAGKIGKALHLDSGYLTYPVIPNLGGVDSLRNGFTLSLWVNSPSKSWAFSSFFQITSTVFPDIWGQIQMGADTHYGQGGDTLPLNARFVQIDGHSNDNYVHVQNFDLPYGSFLGAGQWSLLALSYNPSNDSLTVYGNGARVGAVKANVIFPGETFLLQQPAQPLIGTFAFKEDGFTNAPLSTDRTFAGHGVRADIDDIRLFKAPLSPAQIKALFDLGSAGR